MSGCFWPRKRNFIKLYSIRAGFDRLSVGMAKLKESASQNTLTLTVIHDMTGDSNSGYVTWETWFNHAGVLKTPLTRGYRINNSAAVLQAAVSGQGIALARSVMACDDVKSGRLILLLPEVTVLSPLSYYAVYREEYISKPRLKSLLAWLKEEASRDFPASETKIQKRAEAAAKRIRRSVR